MQKYKTTTKKTKVPPPTYLLGGIKYTFPHPKDNPGRTPEEQQELENGLREAEEYERWCYEQEQIKNIDYENQYR